TVTANCGGVFVVGDEGTPRAGAMTVRGGVPQDPWDPWDQARLAIAWLNVADGRMIAAALAASGW
ncbi:hypothetical protein, partial [Streptomyces goshikiensis]